MSIFQQIYIDISNKCQYFIKFVSNPSMEGRFPTMGLAGILSALVQKFRLYLDICRYIGVCLCNYVQVIPIESKWIQVSPSESDWIQVNPSDSKWVQMNPSESDWIQVSPNESKWIQVSPSESKWIQVNPSEAPPSPSLLSNFSWPYR